MSRPKGLPKTGGKPKGYKHEGTLEKEEMRRLFRQRVAERFQDLIQAQIESAVGVSHMMAKGRDGKWIQVTDPDVMVKCLNSGESFYKITANNPNVLALKDVFDRVMDQAVKGVEVTGKDGGPLVLRHELAE